MRRARAFIARTIRAGKLVATDRRIPRPLRWAAGIGVLPTPGPFDEGILVLVAPVLFVFYPGPMRDAWARAGAAASPVASAGRAEAARPGAASAARLPPPRR